MEVAAGRLLSTCCTCLRRVDTDGRVQCAECFDKSIMRACARRPGGRGNTFFSSSSSSSSSSSAHRSDPRRSSSSSSSVNPSSSSSSCHTCPSSGGEPCPHDNPFASAVRYLPFPGRPRVVMIKNPVQSTASQFDGNPRNTAAAVASFGENTRLAPAASSLEVAVPRDTVRLSGGNSGCQHHASGERGGGGHTYEGEKISARSAHGGGGGGGGGEMMAKRITAERVVPGDAATLLANHSQQARPYSDETMAAVNTKTKTKVMPLLSKAVSMIDRTAALMISAGEQTRSEPTAAMKTVRLRHSRGGGSISSFMSVVGTDAGFLDELLSSFSAPCSPGDGKGDERGSSKQGGSTSPLWERRCFTRPAMLEINSVAVPV